MAVNRTIQELQRELQEANERSDAAVEARSVAAVQRRNARKAQYAAYRQRAYWLAGQAASIDGAPGDDEAALLLGRSVIVPIGADVQIVAGGAFVGATVFIPEDDNQ